MALPVLGGARPDGRGDGALPTIVGELGGLDYYSWVVTAYLLSSTVATPLFGKISDMYGRRTVLHTGDRDLPARGPCLPVRAQTMLQLAPFFRGVQGVGAGGLMTMTFAVIGDVVSPRQRGRYIGLLAGAWAFASVIGPLIGGFLVDNASWRWGVFRQPAGRSRGVGHHVKCSPLAESSPIAPDRFRGVRSCSWWV